MINIFINISNCRIIMFLVIYITVADIVGNAGNCFYTAFAKTTLKELRS